MITMTTTGYFGAFGFAAIEVVLRFDMDKPLEMCFDFYDDAYEERITWTVSRDLVDLGTQRLVGDGDVQFWSSDDGFFYMRMMPHAESSVVRFNLDHINRFLVDVFSVVPIESENTAVEHMINQGIEKLFS